MAKSPETDTAAAGDRVRLADIRRLEKTKGPAAAERAVIAFLREDPKSAQGFLALSRLLLKQKRYDDAARAAEKARTLAPLEAEPSIALGLVLSRKKDHAKAAAAYADAIKIDPKSTRAYVGAAAVRYAAGEFDAALEIVERALALEPQMQRALELKARILLKTEDRTGAEAALETLVRAHPRNDRATKAYMRLMRAEERGEEALALLEEDAAAHPDDRARVMRLSKAALKAARPDLAVANAKRFLDKGTKRADDRLRYVSVLIAAGEADAAEAEIQALVGTRKILAPLATKLRGDIALKAGDSATALERYRTVCQKAKIDPPGEDALAEAASPEDTARVWSRHTRRHLAHLARARRQDRAEAS